MRCKCCDVILTSPVMMEVTIEKDGEYQDCLVESELCRTCHSLSYYTGSVFDKQYDHESIVDGLSEACGFSDNY